MCIEIVEGFSFRKLLLALNMNKFQYWVWKEFLTLIQLLQISEDVTFIAVCTRTHELALPNVRFLVLFSIINHNRADDCNIIQLSPGADHSHLFEIVSKRTVQISGCGNF